jgi:hypothetical protein
MPHFFGKVVSKVTYAVLDRPAERCETKVWLSSPCSAIARLSSSTSFKRGAGSFSSLTSSAMTRQGREALLAAYIMAGAAFLCEVKFAPIRAVDKRQFGRESALAKFARSLFYAAKDRAFGVSAAFPAACNPRSSNRSRLRMRRSFRILLVRFTCNSSFCKL